MDASRLDPAFSAEILLQSADPIFFLDSEGRIRVWNRGAELLFGWSAEEAVGRHVDILIPEDQSVAPQLEQLQEHEHDAVVVQNYETVFRAKGDRRIPVKITITLIRDRAGKTFGSTVTVRDITREKRLENELRWRIGEMELLDEVMHAVQGTLDLQRILRVILTTVTAGSGLGFNRAILFLITGDRLEARLAIGSSNWEEAGRMWPRVANTPDLKSVITYVLEAEEDPTPTVAQRLIEDWQVPLSDVENVLAQCARDGRSVVWPQEGVSGAGVAERLQSPMFTAIPLVHAGKSIGVVLADNPVTKRPIDEHAVRLLRLLASGASSAIVNARLYEEVFQHAQKLEGANQQIRTQQSVIVRAQHMAALGQIAATISHEVKQPLVPIGGFARAMRRDMPPNSPHGEMLDIIIKEVDRLERVVKGVIALASMPLPALRPIAFEKLVENVYGMFDAEADARHITLATDIPGDLPWPHLDDDQWHQLLINLVSNAMTATPDRGTITTSLCLIEDGWYRITVSDTGVGVPKENIPKVFSPLYTTKPTGTGMGLNIVAQIVQRHYGRVAVESTVGKGTSIRIDVPSPDQLHRLVEAERRAAEGQEELEQLDPLTVATLKPAGRAEP